MSTEAFGETRNCSALIWILVAEAKA